MLPALLASGACSGRADTDESNAGATNSPDTPVTAVEPVQGSGTAVDPELSANTEDPFHMFGLASASDVDATVDTTSVWLINEGPTALVVTAEAGAESVVIDTIPAADSVRVRIATRGSWVRLSATTAEGEPVGTTSLRADGQAGRVAFPR